MFHRLLVACCSSVYKYVAKPVLFKMPPDTVHEKMLQFCRAFGSVRMFRWITNVIFKRKSPLLKQEYHGVTFTSPVGIAAGFDKNGDTPSVISNLGFGFMTVGSVTALVCDGNPRPWFQRLPKSKALAVRVGLANQGSFRIIKRLEQNKKRFNAFPITLSVAKTNNKETVSDKAAIKDYTTSIERTLHSTSIKMIEINISCPNTYGGEPFIDPPRLDQLLSAVDAITVPQPIFVKMPNDLPWQSFKQLLDIIVKHNIQGVTVTNLTKSRDNVKDILPFPIRGGLSGKLTWENSNELIKKTYQTYGDRLTIIGVGGVFTAEDAYTKIRLGASLVGLVTGMIYQGPQIAAEINAQLPRLLEKDGLAHIQEAIGLDAQ